MIVKYNGLLLYALMLVKSLYLNTNNPMRNFPHGAHLLFLHQNHTFRFFVEVTNQGASSIFCLTLYNSLLLKDAPNTGLILKLVEDNGQQIQIVLRLHTSSDEPGYKNSVISAWKISESRWNNYIRNKKILYKKELD